MFGSEATAAAELGTNLICSTIMLCTVRLGRLGPAPRRISKLRFFAGNIASDLLLVQYCEEFLVYNTLLYLLDNSSIMERFREATVILGGMGKVYSDVTKRRKAPIVLSIVLH